LRINKLKKEEFYYFTQQRLFKKIEIVYNHFVYFFIISIQLNKFCCF